MYKYYSSVRLLALPRVHPLTDIHTYPPTNAHPQLTSSSNHPPIQRSTCVYIFQSFYLPVCLEVSSHLMEFIFDEWKFRVTQNNIF